MDSLQKEQKVATLSYKCVKKNKAAAIYLEPTKCQALQLLLSLLSQVGQSTADQTKAQGKGI